MFLHNDKDKNDITKRELKILKHRQENCTNVGLGHYRISTKLYPTLYLNFFKLMTNFRFLSWIVLENAYICWQDDPLKNPPLNRTFFKPTRVRYKKSGSTVSIQDQNLPTLDLHENLFTRLWETHYKKFQFVVLKFWKKN